MKEEKSECQHVEKCGLPAWGYQHDRDQTGYKHPFVATQGVPVSTKWEELRNILNRAMSFGPSVRDEGYLNVLDIMTDLDKP